MIPGILVALIGLAILIVYQPTYDQIYNGWWPVQLVIMVAGVAMLALGTAGAIAGGTR